MHRPLQLFPMLCQGGRQVQAACKVRNTFYHLCQGLPSNLRSCIQRYTKQGMTVAVEHWAVEAIPDSRVSAPAKPHDSHAVDYKLCQIGTRGTYL